MIEGYWEEDFNILTKTMDGQYRPQLRLFVKKLLTTRTEQAVAEERARSEKLWEILDSIDSLPDMLHPSDAAGHEKCWRMMVKRAEKRHEVLQTDGYTLSALQDPRRGGGESV